MPATLVHILTQIGFAVILAGAVKLIVDMIRDDYETILLALQGPHDPDLPVSAPPREQSEGRA